MDRLENKSILAQTSLSSPLRTNSDLKPEGRKETKKQVATVLLTSLIDAFSILVIYLLVSFSNSGEILYLSKDMELPQAVQSEVLKRSTLVKLENNRLYIEDQVVPANQLVRELVGIRKNRQGSDDLSLTIQADRRLPYKTLNSIVLASSQAGFNEVKFAVLSQ